MLYEVITFPLPGRTLAIRQRLSNVYAAYSICTIQIRNCTGNFQNAGITPCRQAETAGRIGQQGPSYNFV